MTARADRFFLLDSMRGIAALMVLSVHTAWFSGIFNTYVDRFEAAFAIFFVISGFLLYRPFVKARLLGRPPVSVRAYGWRRLLRIAPAFWVALTVVALWTGPGFSSVGEVVRNYGFLQLYYGAAADDVIPQAWTLSVEVVFYLFLPVWAWSMRRLPAGDDRSRLRTELVALSGLFLLSLAYTATLTYSNAVDRITYGPVGVLAAMPGYLDHLALGMLLAVVSIHVEELRGDLPRPVAFLARFPAAGWAIAVTAMVAGGLVIGNESVYTPSEYLFRHLINSLVAVSVVIPAIFGDAREGIVRRVLGTPAIVYVGLISYSFYLYHWAVLRQIFEWQLDGSLEPGSYWAWLGLALAGALAIGSLSYYLVERPAMSLKRLVPWQRREDRHEALAEPAPAAPVTAPPA